MDQNEIIALSIVAVAALLAIRYFCKRKGGGCCGSGCPSHLNKKEDPEKK